jgi:hypothetical protein
MDSLTSAPRLYRLIWSMFSYVLNNKCWSKMSAHLFCKLLPSDFRKAVSSARLELFINEMLILERGSWCRNPRETDKVIFLSVGICQVRWQPTTVKSLLNSQTLMVSSSAERLWSQSSSTSSTPDSEALTPHCLHASRQSLPLPCHFLSPGNQLGHMRV